MSKRIPRKFFTDRCECGGQYIAGMCDGCGNVEARDDE